MLQLFAMERLNGLLGNIPSDNRRPTVTYTRAFMTWQKLQGLDKWIDLSDDETRLLDIVRRTSVENDSFDPNYPQRRSKVNQAVLHYKYAFDTENIPRGNEPLPPEDRFCSPLDENVLATKYITKTRDLVRLRELCVELLGEEVDLNMQSVHFFKRALVFGNMLTSENWGNKSDKHPKKALVLVR